MSDIDTIKARIRKLMAVAGCGAAMDGEIDNALKLAAKLMDAHHLEQSDIPTEDDERDMSMGDAVSVSTASRYSTWESVLGSAIASLFGCVKHYIAGENSLIRVNGIVQFDAMGQPRYGKKIVWYGPVSEAREAAELFEEWSRSIAAMGVARWGGCYRGDGAMYCYGFANALLKKANEINAQRRLVDAKPLPLLTYSGANAEQVGQQITLRTRYDLLKEEAGAWLKKEKGVELRSGGRTGGYSGSIEAFSEGRSHGERAEFGRKQSRKMLGNGGSL